MEEVRTEEVKALQLQLVGLAMSLRVMVQQRAGVLELLQEEVGSE